MTLQQYVRNGSFYKAVVEDGSDLIFVVDYQGNITYHNASVRDALGYRSMSLIGKNFFDFVLPSTAGGLKEQFRKSQKRAYTESVEFQFLSSDNSYRFLEFNAINLKHREGLEGFILDCRDITDRRRNAEELLRLQKAKEQFLANISHEIRTPINGIAGMADLLSQETSADERNTYLNAIRHSAENLKVIINDILDLAAIESGKLRFEKIGFNLTDLLPSLIATFAYQAKEKNLKLDYSIEEQLNCVLLGDPVRLNQILINLIGNAVKFTHRGSIQVTCSLEKKHKHTRWIKLEVKDTGIGIRSEKLDTIFESFSQADETFTRKYGGSGLGLTIVRQLVELQKGRISVDSREDQGSAFSVVIPYLAGKPSPMMPSQDSIAMGSEPAKHLRILLVEDNDINRLYARTVLEKWKYRVDTAENGLVAIEKIKNTDYDLILMDVQMPVMDGYEATKAIRLMGARKKETRIIALTANATGRDIEKCLQAGMNDYLAKPFTPDDLMRKILREPQAGSEKGFEEPSPPPESTFDLTYLRTVSNNNEEFVRDMMQTFVQTMPGILSQMTQAVANSNWEQLGKLAHQVKPSFMLMGITHLRPSILFIEENGKGNHRDLVHTTNEFIKSCQSLIRDFNRELASP